MGENLIRMNVYEVITVTVGYLGDIKFATSLHETLERAVAEVDSCVDSQKVLEGKLVRSEFKYGEEDLVFIPGLVRESNMKYCVKIVCSCSWAEDKVIETWRGVFEKEVK